MNIRKEFLTVNPFSRPGRKLSVVKGIVLHWVANAGTSAMMNRNYFDSLALQSPDNQNARYASAHYVVDISGEIVRCLPDEEMAYHVGASWYAPEAVELLGSYPNASTIGIELCHPKADGKFSEETLRAAVELCAALCSRYALDPFYAILTHHDVTGKNCPQWFVNNPDAFANFKTDVAEAMINKLEEAI